MAPHSGRRQTSGEGTDMRPSMRQVASDLGLQTAWYNPSHIQINGGMLRAGTVVGRVGDTIVSGNPEGDLHQHYV